MGNDTQAMQVATEASQCNEEMWRSGEKWLRKSTYTHQTGECEKHKTDAVTEIDKL